MVSSVQNRKLQEAGFDLAALPAVHGGRSRRPNGRLFEAVITKIEILADTAAIILALLSAYGIYQVLELGNHYTYPITKLVGVACGFAITYVLLLERTGAYHPGNSLLRVRETERILRAGVQAALVAYAISYFTQFLFSRWLLALSFVAVPLFLIIEKQIIYSLVRYLHSWGYGVQRVVIYGAGLTGRRLFSALARSPKLGLEPVAFVDDNAELQGSDIFECSYHRRRSAHVAEGPLTRDLIRDYQADVVLVGIPSIGRPKFIEIISEASAAGASVCFVPYHVGPSVAWIDYADVDGLLLAWFKAPHTHDRYEVSKRIFDVVASILTLVVSLPLLLVIWALIRLTSPGPAIFSQERVGRGGAPFRMHKFRTMVSDAPAYSYSPTCADDPRITRLGRLLRRTSLDELPQIFNVLKGEMSLVGPRPEMPFIVDQYEPLHRQRLDAKPGITGLWQLSADRRYLIHENIEYDLYYIRNRSFFMDVAILLHTCFFAMRGV